MVICEINILVKCDHNNIISYLKHVQKILIQPKI